MSRDQRRDEHPSYGLAVATALLGLSPYVAVATAFTAVAPLVGADLDASPTAVQVAGGLGNAAYAVGLVLAAQLGLRFTQRRLFLFCTPLLVLGALLGALASDAVVLTVSRVLQGGAAGAMTICVLPVLLTRFETARMPVSAGVISLGLFGSSAAGPLIGGLLAEAGHWRAMFVVMALVAAAAWVVAWVGFPAFDPTDPEREVDTGGLALVVLAATAVFLATSLLTGHAWLSWWVLPGLVVGLLALAALVVVEDRVDDALVPVRALATQLPVTGIVAVMVGGATFVAALELTQTYLTETLDRSPGATGLLLWPAVPGALLAALACGLLLRTRLLPVLVDVGLGCLLVATVLVVAVTTGRDPGLLVPVAAGLLGLGAGSTITPGLLLIGFGLPIAKLGRAFAMVQLLRSTATYAVAPVVAHVAAGAADPAGGVRTGLVVLAVLAGLGLALALLVPLVSGAHLRRPDLEAWRDGGQGLPSPETGERLKV